MSASSQYLVDNLGAGFYFGVPGTCIPPYTGAPATSAGPPAGTGPPDYWEHVSRLPLVVRTDHGGAGAPSSPYDLTLSPRPRNDDSASDIDHDPLHDVAGHFCDTSDSGCGVPSSDSDVCRALLDSDELTDDHKAHAAGRCARCGPVSPRDSDSEDGAVTDVTTVYYPADARGARRLW